MPQTHLCAMAYAGRPWVVYIGRLRVAHIGRLWVAHTGRLRVAHTGRLWVAHTMRSRMDHYNPVNDNSLSFQPTLPKKGDNYPASCYTERHRVFRRETQREKQSFFNFSVNLCGFSVLSVFQ